MPWMKWLPWRYLIRRFAQKHGFLDPLALMARLHRFGQPSEVNEPIELLRSGVAFHARGLINSRVIQHNLDWVWPFWVTRQYDPADTAFVPRAFNITHINLTHRNWTAVGIPDCESLPIVDPCGMLTPILDGWSLDGWIVGDDGRQLFPSRVGRAEQTLEMDDGVAIVTETRAQGMVLRSRAHVEADQGRPVCRLDIEGESEISGWLVLALRPFNPEGISFIHRIDLDEARRTWTVDVKHRVELSAPMDRHVLSDYRSGDVSRWLHTDSPARTGMCEIGLATAAAMYRLEPGERRSVGARIALERPSRARPSWSQALDGRCRLEIADPTIERLFEAATRSLVLHSPADVYPGPYTYKRFWFRDSAFIIHALLCLGFIGRAERAIDRFFPRQTAMGFFHSQEGEWDSNGEALWTIRQFCRMTGRPPKSEWRPAIVRGAKWILRKRLDKDAGEPIAGLLPAGFSAEHLGPNDNYYWDNFWGIAGLEAAADLCAAMGDESLGRDFAATAAAYRRTVESNIEAASRRFGRAAMPASPHRRLDAGAIGSIAAGYPLQLFAPDDPRLLDTVDFLIENCFFAGGFFQDMIHSGINAYLTLHVAQVLLRAGDLRSLELVANVAELASPTGQWPEAIHPRTGGGCMGDGQHVWAAADWIVMVRNCFVREEGNRLVLCGGVPPVWWADEDRPARLGPTQTAFGPVTVEVARRKETEDGERKARVSWQASWTTPPAAIEVRLPGQKPVVVKPEEGAVEIGAARAA